MSKILRTSEEWQKLLPDQIVLNPNGWDKTNFQFSWFEELITAEQYFERTLISTCKWQNVMSKKFYRVCHKDTLQGLWYDYQGQFTGLIHNDFNFCANKDLEMDFDPEIVGWLSATESLEQLWQWFTKEDIQKLQDHGWFIHEFEAVDYKLYERFQHIVIKQDTSVVNKLITLNDMNSVAFMIEFPSLKE
jgi:hypothetical protein